MHPVLWNEVAIEFMVSQGLPLLHSIGSSTCNHECWRKTTRKEAIKLEEELTGEEGVMWKRRAREDNGRGYDQKTFYTCLKIINKKWKRKERNLIPGGTHEICGEDRGQTEPPRSLTALRYPLEGWALATKHPGNTDFCRGLSPGRAAASALSRHREKMTLNFTALLQCLFLSHPTMNQL